MTSTVPIPPHDVLANWADLSTVTGAPEGFAHHGLSFTDAGDLLGFHAGQLVTLDRDGSVRETATPGATPALIEGHGLTVVREGTDELVWIADPGFAIACGAGTADGLLPPTFGLGLDLARGPGRVVQLTLTGAVVRELERPPGGIDDAPGPFTPYAPTSVAVDELSRGGTGDVWVADGYGSNVVHRYDAAGRHLSVLTGAEGGGRFNCPHAVFIDRRSGKSPELYVADRGNARLAVYDLDGQFLRLSGEGVVDTPSDFALWQGYLVVAELGARLTLLDKDDQLVGRLGADPQAQSRPGWPNALDGKGVARRPDQLLPGILNSPHAVAVSPHGDLVVAEWLIGSRYTTFRSETPAP